MAKRKAAKPKKVVKKIKSKNLSFGQLVLVTLTRSGSRNMVGKVTGLADDGRACINYTLNEKQQIIGAHEEWILLKNIKAISLKN